LTLPEYDLQLNFHIVFLPLPFMGEGLSLPRTCCGGWGRRAGVQLHPRSIAGRLGPPLHLTPLAQFTLLSIGRENILKNNLLKIQIRSKGIRRKRAFLIIS
jgi:hypothetical protein